MTLRLSVSCAEETLRDCTNVNGAAKSFTTPMKELSGDTEKLQELDMYMRVDVVSSFLYHYQY